MRQPYRLVLSLRSVRRARRVSKDYCSPLSPASFFSSLPPPTQTLKIIDSETDYERFLKIPPYPEQRSPYHMRQLRST